MALRPWTDDEAETLRKLHSQGMSLNAIAKQMGRSKDLISRRSAQLGLDYDRTRTAQATKAHEVDARARMVEAAHRELDILHLNQQRILDVYEGRAQHKTKMRTDTGAERFVTVDFLPPQDERDLAGARSAASTVLSRLNQGGVTDGVDSTKAMLAQLGKALGIA